MDGAFHSRLGRHFAGKVKAEKRIGIQVMKGEVEIGGKVGLQSNATGDREVSFLEFGMGVEIELPSMGDGIEIEVTRALLIESKVLKMKVCIDCRLFGGAACSHREIGDAIRPEATGLEAGEMREAQVLSGDIQAEIRLP